MSEADYERALARLARSVRRLYASGLSEKLITRWYDASMNALNARRDREAG
jgi:hypothetical protein